MSEQRSSEEVVFDRTGAHVECICQWQRVYQKDDLEKPTLEIMKKHFPQCPVHSTVEVTIFKPTGKYYTTERWTIPLHAIGPYDMQHAKERQRWTGDWIFVIEAQEPWGFPHLIRG